MTVDTADAAIDHMFRSPNRNIKVEFQGGESLLNFSIIQHIVKRTIDLNADHDRNLQFVIATNLVPLTSKILDFCREYDISLSTSLDGPRDLHNANRPRPDHDSYERTIDGIARARDALGHDAVSALMTTTRRSLSCPEAIVDEYIEQGFTSIFLRWMSPYGFANRSKAALGYNAAEYVDFYKRALAHILKCNSDGQVIREEYAAIILRKLLTSYPCTYVDLQSPAGLGIAAVVYNYDGDVFASDEARMLAQTGDPTFRLGQVSDPFEVLYRDSGLPELLMDTMTERIPQCHQCAYEPYCGTDPVLHHAIHGDPIGHRPTSPYCQRNMAIIKHLVSLLDSDDDVAQLLTRWAFE